MGAHEEEGEDEKNEGAEPMQVGPQLGGPRDIILTHKAPVMWTATEQLTLPNADPVDPHRDPKVLKPYTRSPHFNKIYRGGIPILTLVDRCKKLCRARERNESHVVSMHLLMLLGSTVFIDKTTQKSWIWEYFHGLRGHSQPSVTGMRDARAARQDGREAPQPPSGDDLTEMRQVLDVIPFEQVS
ncbi:hypothetical protein V2J09_010684 [Rumex salicifolius]